MVLDYLLRLRDGGASAAITSKTTGGGEAGATSLTRDTNSGKVVVQVNELAEKGMAVVVAAPAPSLAGDESGSMVVTIEAADELAFNVTNETIATFPTIDKNSVASLKVRRIHTKKKYVRSVVTKGAANDTNYITIADLNIFLGDDISER